MCIYTLLKVLIGALLVFTSLLTISRNYHGKSIRVVNASKGEQNLQTALKDPKVSSVSPIHQLQLPTEDNSRSIDPITMSSSAAGTSSKLRAASSQPSETSSKRKRGVFQKELQHMMYGFGDDPNPLPESVSLMEDIVVEYVTELVHKAQDIGSQRGKLAVEDFLYLIRKDLPKLNRCTELLTMNEELKQARKVFESDEEKLRKVFEVDETVEG